MKAITFSAPIPRYLATAVAGRLSKDWLVGPHACTGLGDIEIPRLPAEKWVRIRTVLGGICGSDLGIISLSTSPSTSPLSSFPFVLGHESVGVIEQCGRQVRQFAVGDRVTVNPLLCCEARDIVPPCAACAAGRHSRCVRFTDGMLPPGMFIGTTRGVGGSWGELFVAHEAQLVRVPDTMSNEDALLVEPLACGVHAVREELPLPRHRILVVGAGTLGLLVVAALRALAPGNIAITILARHTFQAQRAVALGAQRAILAHGNYTAELADAGGTRLLTPVLGRPIGLGGFDSVYVCAGGARGMEDAMRVCREGGEITLLGNVATLKGLDWTPLWLKELRLRGTLAYGNHAHGSSSVNALNEAAGLIASGAAPVAGLLTHRFPIARYRTALRQARAKNAHESIKVAFEF